MKQLSIILLLSIYVNTFAQGGEKNFIDQNYIEVTGKAELEIVPDMIYLKIVLSDKDNKEKLTLPKIEEKVKNKLSEAGVDVNKDLSLKDFAGNLRPYGFKANVALTKEYQLIVHDARTLQKVFLELQKLGISNVSIEKLEHSKIEQYRKEVKVNAVKAAKEKAGLLTGAINQNIGKALYIQEADALSPYLASNALAGRIAGANVKMKSVSYDSVEDAILEIEFEKIKVESTILVRFELK